MVKVKSTRESYKGCAQLMHMAFPIRDVYTFEQFSSMAEFTDSLESNQWIRHYPDKKVKIKGKQTLGIRLQNKGNKGIFVKLDFSKILKELDLKQPEKIQPDFETFVVKNKHGKNAPSCFISIDDSGGKYTVQSILLVKDKEDESERILFITTVLDMKNRINEIRRRRLPSHRLPRQSNDDDDSYYDDDDDDDDDDSYFDDDDDDDDWWDYDSGGRTPNDDRSDSMNPNSHRYNPGR